MFQALRSHITRVAPDADFFPIDLLIRKYGHAARLEGQATEATAVISEVLRELTEQRDGRRR